MRVKITKSARRFGYVIWNGALDSDVRNLIGDVDKIGIVFNQISLGEKSIDWAHHRIYIGTTITRGLGPNQTHFNLERNDKAIEITTIGGS